MTTVASLPVAGRALDRQVALAIFGTDAPHAIMAEYDLPYFSTDIACAWEVVEKLQHGGPRGTYWWSLETPWIEPSHFYVARILEGSVEIARGEAPSMAESICLAALKAVAP